MKLFALMIIAVFVERFAASATQMATFTRAHAVGLESSALSSSFTAATIGAVVAGLLACAVLPRVVLVAATALAAAGLILAGISSDKDAVLWGFRFAQAGAGALNVCLVGVAFLVTPSARARTAFVVAIALAARGAYFVGSPLAGFFGEVAGAAPVLIGAGVLVALGAAPAIAVIVIDRVAAARGDAGEPAPPARHDRALVGALAMGAASALCTGGSFLVVHRLSAEGVSPSSVGLVIGVVSFLTLMALSVAVALLASRPELPPATPLVAAGLCAAGAGALTIIAPSAVAVVLGDVLFALASVAAPFALARSLQTQHPRLVTLAASLAGFLAMCVPALLELGTVAGFVVLSAMALIGAVALFTRGRAFEVWLDEPTAPRRESFLNPA